MRSVALPQRIGFGPLVNPPIGQTLEVLVARPGRPEPHGERLGVDHQQRRVDPGAGVLERALGQVVPRPAVASGERHEAAGRVADVPWAIVFPHGGETPRHPSQLYEAFLEGVVLFIVLAILAHRPGMRARVGFLTGVFPVGYGFARTFVEFFREPDAQLGFILGPITMGQILSAPMVLLGLYLMVRARRPAEEATTRARMAGGS
ncbi:MAG: hypothetical protein GEV13_18030 [Rhodospirillales bacterium]|nr:hypothetical protein [Rhodospirillales bacterium]